jgi:hypothetical protein
VAGANYYGFTRCIGLTITDWLPQALTCACCASFIGTLAEGWLIGWQANLRRVRKKGVIIFLIIIGKNYWKKTRESAVGNGSEPKNHSQVVVEKPVVGNLPEAVG